MLYLIWILSCLYGHVGSDMNPCSDYQTVNDTIINKKWDDSGFKTPCEYFPKSYRPSWYRINGRIIGNVVNLDCPDSKKCGGNINMWINDTLPGKNDGITFVRVCGSTSSGCCTLRNQIRVKNCNNFYVFELLRPPRCDAKYCFNWTVDGLETDTKTDASSSTSTVSTTRHTSPSFITFSSDSFTTTKQTSLQSTTTTTTNAWTTPLITSRTTQITIDGFLSTDSTTTSTPLVYQGTQEISTSTTPWLTTNASSKVQTDITTKSPTSNISSLTVTITVSVLSGVFAIFIFVVVIACLRRKRNTRKRILKRASLHLKLYSTSEELHL